jgi:broad specificity phosphatase PhoE/quercetin dioxygenase-like cupin family protein
MSIEQQPQQHIESKERPDFKISIIVHRHGPKEGIAGPLSNEGKQMTKEYFDFVAEQGIGEVDVEHSPVGRTRETAEIFSDAVTRKHGAEKIKSIQFDERLSEGDVAEHPDLIDEYGGRGGKWIKGWMEAEKRSLPEVKTGKETAADFADWILSKISAREKQGGEQEVQAFSHGPVMVAFISKLEEKLGEKVLPENLSIFIGSYLSLMDFYADSSRSDIVNFSFGSKKFEIPVSMLQELVHENQFMADALKDVSDDSVKNWLSNENLSSKNKRVFQGFEITDSIDSSTNTEREVSLVKIAEVGKYPQHTHDESDAIFTIVSGSATFLSGDKKREIKAGDKIKIPRGMPHGFELKEGDVLEFISIQSPPIRNPETGKEDFCLSDFV